MYLPALMAQKLRLSSYTRKIPGSISGPDDEINFLTVVA